MWLIISCSNGWVRVLGARDPAFLDVRYLIAGAMVNCELTARPAYREMIDTLDWGAIL